MIGGETRAADEASVGAWIGGLAALVDASGAQATGIIRIAAATGGEPDDSEHLGDACESDARGGSVPKRHTLRIADPEGTAAAGRSLARRTPPSARASRPPHGIEMVVSTAHAPRARAAGALAAAAQHAGWRCPSPRRSPCRCHLDANPSPRRSPCRCHLDASPSPRRSPCRCHLDANPSPRRSLCRCHLDASPSPRRTRGRDRQLSTSPSNGVDFAASPSHAPLELEQQDCMLDLGEGQGTSLEQEVRGPATAPTHDLKQA
jgi:hypothetical protein